MCCISEEISPLGKGLYADEDTDKAFSLFISMVVILSHVAVILDPAFCLVIFPCFWTNTLIDQCKLT